jgi:hypothetical protein
MYDFSWIVFPTLQVRSSGRAGFVSRNDSHEAAMIHVTSALGISQNGSPFMMTWLYNLIKMPVMPRVKEMQDTALHLSVPTSSLSKKYLYLS